jgi:subtilisin family serine protease
MKKQLIARTLIMVVAGGFLAFTACQKDNEPVNLSNDNTLGSPGLKAGGNGAATYIVVLNESFEAAGELTRVKGYDERKQVMAGYLNRFLNGNGVGQDQVEQTYTNVFMGFAARLSGPQLARLQQDPMVSSIEPDQEILLGKPTGGTTQPAQTVPWGITRVGGAGNGAGKTAWVIDSGIDLDHPDLNVDVARSKSFLSTSTSPDDQNGHGTHVAGIIAAKNNTIGVVGVAADATVVAVRVLDRRGSGSLSGVKANANTNEVANMSLGGGISTALDAAVLAMSANVKVSLAAGNESDNANNHSPARVNGNNIYTVSAMGTGDVWASYSNYGNPPVDFCAPGSSIYSCYKGGTYATMSGTSMAAPHVAGILLLGSIATSGYVSGDPDGNPDPIAHR